MHKNIQFLLWAPEKSKKKFFIPLFISIFWTVIWSKYVGSNNPLIRKIFFHEEGFVITLSLIIPLVYNTGNWFGMNRNSNSSRLIWSRENIPKISFKSSFFLLISGLRFSVLFTLIFLFIGSSFYICCSLLFISFVTFGITIWFSFSLLLSFRNSPTSNFLY